MYEGFEPGPVILLKSIGCRTNQEELVTLKSQLQQSGYTFTEEVTRADIVIVNTCAVTAHTESKTRRILQAIATQAPGAKILVTGCLAQQQPENLSSLKGIHWVVGNTLKQKIPQLLTTEQGGIFHTCFSEEQIISDEFNPDFPLLPPSDSVRTRFSVKIQEGCNYHCAYCIVPQVRGPARSFNSSEIVDLCKRAIDTGYREIVLTGTHIGQFRDMQGGFLELLLKITIIPGSFRVRLSSLDPRDCTDELLYQIGTNPKICDHLHVSVQNFDREVLKNMGRGSTDPDVVLGQLQAFRAKFPHAGLGADIIVGFPGETEIQFESTINSVKNAGFSYAHLFRYSVRPGTVAESLPGKISEKEKTERSEILREIVTKSRETFINQCIGIPYRIIVESEQPVRGLTSNFLHVELPDASAVYNSWLDVMVTGYEHGRYYPAKTC